MSFTVLHITRGLGSSSAESMLKQIVLANQGRFSCRQVIASLTGHQVPKDTLRAAGVEVHSLELKSPWSLPTVLFRLVCLMRRTRPDVVMTWHYHADFIGTFATVMSGVGPSRMVWNLSCSRSDLSSLTRKTRLLLKFLGWVSPWPWSIAISSRHGKRAHETLGFHPRGWSHLPNRTRNFEQTLNRYRQLWRAVRNYPVPPRSALERTLPWLDKKQVARLRRSLLNKTRFISVTGSCGKTVTTKLASKILGSQGLCYRGRHGNVFRGQIRTILSLPANSHYCVQEVSAFPPGTIATHSQIFRPEIAVVTTIGGDHYKSFRNLEVTAKEKGQLVERLLSKGTAILNADDPYVRAMADRTKAKVLTFGLSPDAHIRAIDVSSVWPNRLALTVQYGEESLRVQTRLAGQHWTTSVLAAIACGIACGIDLQTCARVIKTFQPVLGRYSVHAKGDGATYVLDTQKAPLWTIASGLAFVREAQAPRKTIVFGTISDYPGASSPKYRKIAREALEVAHRVIFVGPQSGHVSRLAKEELQERLFAFQSSYQASALLANDSVAEELIYVKASITDHLERLMLSQMDQVLCWRERCGRREFHCSNCPNLYMPHQPPFGIGQQPGVSAHQPVQI